VSKRFLRLPPSTGQQSQASPSRKEKGTCRVAHTRTSRKLSKQLAYTTARKVPPVCSVDNELMVETTPKPQGRGTRIPWQIGVKGNRQFWSAGWGNSTLPGFSPNQLAIGKNDAALLHAD